MENNYTIPVKMNGTSNFLMTDIAKRAKMNRNWFIAPPMDFMEKRVATLIEKFKEYFDAEFSQDKFPKKVMIHGDYDVDGATASAIMNKALKSSFPKMEVIVYLPMREAGYGFTESSSDKVNEINPDLVITVDCGTNDIPLYENANENPSRRYLVIDHHLIDEGGAYKNIPANMQVINVHNFQGLELCAAGLAFFASYVLRGQEVYQSDILAYCAIGTVCDQTPLNNPVNFGLVKMGLEYLNNQRPAWAVNLNTREKFDAGSLGFQIGPRINAISRVNGDPYLSFLALNNDHDAIEQLHKANTKRQEEVEELSQSVLALHTDSESPVILAEIEALPGYLGLIATKLVELTGKPALVASMNGDHFVGSARSVNGVHLVNHVLDKADGLWLRAGGHSAAAGFSYLPENSQKIKDVLASLKLKPEPVERFAYEVGTDNASQYGAAIATFITEPHALGNPSPEFVVKGASITLNAVKGGLYTAIIVSDENNNLARMILWEKYYDIENFIAQNGGKMDNVDVYFRASYDKTSDYQLSLFVNELKFGNVSLTRKTLKLFKMSLEENESDHC